jgi:hypothetical protein
LAKKDRGERRWGGKKRGRKKKKEGMGGQNEKKKGRMDYGLTGAMVVAEERVI